MNLKIEYLWRYCISQKFAFSQIYQKAHIVENEEVYEEL